MVRYETRARAQPARGTPEAGTEGTRATARVAQYASSEEQAKGRKRPQEPGRPQGSPNMHQAKSESQAGGRAIRRGEGGGCGVGWAFMVARGGEAIVFLQAGSQENRTRATIKAINAAPIHSQPPSPLLMLMGLFLA